MDVRRNPGGTGWLTGLMRYVCSTVRNIVAARWRRTATFNYGHCGSSFHWPTDADRCDSWRDNEEQRAVWAWRRSVALVGAVHSPATRWPAPWSAPRLSNGYIRMHRALKIQNLLRMSSSLGDRIACQLCVHLSDRVKKCRFCRVIIMYFIHKYTRIYTCMLRSATG